MKRRLDVSEFIRTELCHLPPLLKSRVRAALEEIAADFAVGKTLTRDLEGCRSFAVGSLRIVYFVTDSSIQIMAIGPRKTVYQNLIFELKQKLQNP